MSPKLNEFFSYLDELSLIDLMLLYVQSEKKDFEINQKELFRSAILMVIFSKSKIEIQSLEEKILKERGNAKNK